MMLPSDSMALCPNCSNQLPDGKTMCLSCGYMNDDHPRFNGGSPISEARYEHSGSRPQEAPGKQVAVPLPATLGSSLRENDRKVEGKSDYKQRED